jgi:hypothetical protein
MVRPLLVAAIKERECFFVALKLEQKNTAPEGGIP